MTSNDKSKKTIQKVYYSVLVKAASPKSIDSSNPVQNLDEVLPFNLKRTIQGLYYSIISSRGVCVCGLGQVDIGTLTFNKMDDG